MQSSIILDILKEVYHKKIVTLIIYLLMENQLKLQVKTRKNFTKKLQVNIKKIGQFTMNFF